MPLRSSSLNIALWRMAVLENVQGVFPILRAADGVLNRVRTVWIYLYLVILTIRRACAWNVPCAWLSLESLLN